MGNPVKMLGNLASAKLNTLSPEMAKAEVESITDNSEATSFLKAFIRTPESRQTNLDGIAVDVRWLDGLAS